MAERVFIIFDIGEFFFFLLKFFYTFKFWLNSDKNNGSVTLISKYVSERTSRGASLRLAVETSRNNSGKASELQQKELSRSFVRS
jgi:hypothetical protein